MWQRIQTVWWILSILSIALFATQDLLLFTPNGESIPSFVLRSYGLVEIASDTTIKSSYSLLIIEAISMIISLTSIFIYKMRAFQIRLSILNAFVLLGLVGMIAYLGFDFQSEGASLGIKAWLALPFISIIFQALAAQGVIKDELIIRMSNRIR